MNSQEKVLLNICHSSNFSRILFTLLLVVEVAHVADDLLQAVDPLVCLLWTGCHEVEIFLAIIEDDGEAPIFIAGVCVFIKPFRLTALTH